MGCRWGGGFGCIRLHHLRRLPCPSEHLPPAQFRPPSCLPPSQNATGAVGASFSTPASSQVPASAMRGDSAYPTQVACVGQRGGWVRITLLVRIASNLDILLIGLGGTQSMPKASHFLYPAGNRPTERSVSELSPVCIVHWVHCSLPLERELGKSPELTPLRLQVRCTRITLLSPVLILAAGVKSQP